MELMIDTRFFTVQAVTNLTDHTFIVRVPRRGLQFKAGQHISVGIKGDHNLREYSIFSGENDSYLEVLVKEVKTGYFTPRLKRVKNGQLLEIDGPYGKFGISKEKEDTHKHIFIASGTGIAPFHSMVRTKPQLNYHVIHGVKSASEGYGRESFDPTRYTLCTSRDGSGSYAGRVTKLLEEMKFEPNTHFYLCGNSKMIYDALEIIKSKGFIRANVSTEVYF
ncbi:MAG TPA: FAD-binding oxidoreductase [Williamwhitmania sp.]|nr:FAD-binding oxidoreductase [Williamwhitmania sp.]